MNHWQVGKELGVLNKDITWIVTNCLPGGPATDYSFPYRDKVLGVLRAARQVLVAVVTATVEDEGEERQQTTSVGALDLVVTSDFAPSAVKFSDTLRTSSTIQRKFKHNFVLVSREQVLRALYTNPSSVAAGLRAWFANGEKASCEQ
ncbi:unnamed protein product [Fusarium graminearum]|nr:unnamed protein product [Fusarium graminearum]